MLGPPGSRPTGGPFAALMLALADGLDWGADRLERVADALTFTNVVVALLFMVPTFLAAAIVGIGAALITWDEWPFLIVFVTGSLLGGLAMVSAFGVMAFYERWRAGFIWELSDTQGLAIACTLGPAVAIIVAVTVKLSPPIEQCGRPSLQVAPQPEQPANSSSSPNPVRSTARGRKDEMRRCLRSRRMCHTVL